MTIDRNFLIGFLETKVALKGGKGSGFYGHAGRPGKRGGSSRYGVVFTDQENADRAEVKRALGQYKCAPEDFYDDFSGWLDQDGKVYGTRDENGYQVTHHELANKIRDDVSGEVKNRLTRSPLDTLLNLGFSRVGTYAGGRGVHLYVESHFRINREQIRTISKIRRFQRDLDTNVSFTASVRGLSSTSDWFLFSREAVGYALKGGKGSGFYGHVGRPGKRGGSAPNRSGVSFGKTVAVEPEINSNTPSGDVIPVNTGGKSLVHVDCEVLRKIFGDVFERDRSIGRNIDGIITAFAAGGGCETSPVSLGLRELCKDRLVKRLSKATNVSYSIVNSMIETWAGTANDSSARAISMQEAAAEEFGIELSDWQIENTRKLMEQFPGTYKKNEKRRVIERSVLRAMYSATQAYLRARGFEPDDEVVLYRGVKNRNGRIKVEDYGKDVDYRGSAMESWSFSKAIARYFGTTVLSIRCKAKNILALPTTGFGCLPELEAVVIGNNRIRATVSYTIEPLIGDLED